MFVDTCHSGNIMGTRRGGPVDINGIVNELASAENGVVVFAASTVRQYSLEDPQWQNGAFTKSLVEGIEGKASYGKDSGKITINILDVYISERVKELTKGQQTPTTTKPNTVPDFPVAVKQRTYVTWQIFNASPPVLVAPSSKCPDRAPCCQLQ
jgi:hypothetical protein